MLNSTMENQQPTPPPPPVQSPPTSLSHSHKRLIIQLILVGIILISAFFIVWFVRCLIAPCSIDHGALSPVELKITPFQSPSPTPDETVEWKTYRNEEYGFSIQYPPHWIFKDSSELSLLWLGSSIPNEPGQPGNDAIPAIQITMLRSDPTSNWDEQYFTDYQKIPYQLGVFEATKITGIHKMSHDRETVIIASYKTDYYLVQLNPSNKDQQYVDQILSTFRFLEDNNTQEKYLLRYFDFSKKFGFSGEPYPSELINLKDHELTGLNCHTYPYINASDLIEDTALNTFIEKSTEEIAQLTKCAVETGKIVIIYSHPFMENSAAGITVISYLNPDGTAENLATIENKNEFMFSCNEPPLALTKNNVMYLDCSPGSCYNYCSRSVYKVDLNRKTYSEIYKCTYRTEEPEDAYSDSFPTPVTQCK